jgi:hypothetical protein
MKDVIKFLNKYCDVVSNMDKNIDIGDDICIYDIKDILQKDEQIFPYIDISYSLYCMEVECSKFILGIDNRQDLLDSFYYNLFFKIDDLLKHLLSVMVNIRKRNSRKIVRRINDYIQVMMCNRFTQRYMINRLLAHLL